MNWTDIVVLIILVLSTINAYNIGFIKAFVNFFSTIISLIMAYTLYPIVSKILIKSSWFEVIKTTISQNINIQEKTQELTLNAQTTIINNLELPDFLKSMLVQNNNIEIYKLFNVTQLQDYIATYIATICINIIAMIGTFILVLIILKVLAISLDLISKLPIINSINKSIGAILGLVQGVIIIWILCSIATFFYSNPNLQPILLSIQQSAIASIFYNNNLINLMITKIFV